jgi:hypothetical protein
MRPLSRLIPNLRSLGLAALTLAAAAPDAAAQVTVRIGEGVAVQAYDVDLTLSGRIEAVGALDTRGSTITFTQTDGTGGIDLAGGLAVELTVAPAFRGSTVQGPVQLGGPLRVAVAAETDILQGETFPVLACTGGCSGAFERVEAPFAVRVRQDDPNVVTLEALEDYSTRTVGAPADPLPLAIHAPYPNPFAVGTTLRIELDASADVRVEAFDLLGRRVALLTEGTFPAGRHEVRWVPSGLGAGVYVVTARVEGQAVGVWRVTLAR